MSIRRLLRTPIEVRTPTTGAADDWGDLPDVAATSVRERCYWEPSETSEASQPGQSSASTRTVWLQADTTVTAASVLTIDGQAWRTVGDPQPHARPGGASVYYAATIRRSSDRGT